MNTDEQDTWEMLKYGVIEPKEVSMPAFNEYALALVSAGRTEIHLTYERWAPMLSIAYAGIYYIRRGTNATLYGMKIVWKD